MTDGAIDRSAIFSDGTDNFVSPCEPKAYDMVTIRCRVGKGQADCVTAIIDNVPFEMKKTETTKRFDFYETSFLLQEKQVGYYFEIKAGEESVICNRQGVVDHNNPYFNFCIIPDFHTPDWAKGAVMYQIFVDRFNNGDKTNDVLDREYIYIDEPVSQVKDWNKLPASIGFREFYGGDLMGVWKKLDYLQELGVEVLYLNPVFVSPSNHKYDTQDYDHIDPHFAVIAEDGGEVLGEDDSDNTHASKYRKRVVDTKNLEASNRFFAEFVKEVHRRGMKVILDGVFNHCGSFNKWMDREKLYEKDSAYEKGAYLSEDSPYRDFFHFNPDGTWPDNKSYDSWWGNDTLPKLNYGESKYLSKYIRRIAKKWVSAPYYVDGWRLDVAADLGTSPEANHMFWREFRKAVKEVNAEAVILAEHYGDPSPWLDGSQWDTVMNYDAFMEPVSWFLTGMEKHSDVYRQDLMGNAEAFFTSMTDYGARMTIPSAQVAMNELSNHDHSRFLTRTNHKVGRTAFAGPQAAAMGINPAIMRQAVLIQMTWVGAPTVYYGDEVGVCGWTDPDNRRTYPWGMEDQQMLRFHKEMIRIHKDYELFRTGSLIYLYCGNGLIGYGRFRGDQKAFVLVQSGGWEQEIEIEVWRLGLDDGDAMSCMMYTSDQGFHMTASLRYVEDGKVKIPIGKDGAVVWKLLNL